MDFASGVFHRMATVIDLASRRVVGWAIADHMEASLVCDALKIAIAARRPGPGFIMHIDRLSPPTYMPER